MTRCKYAINSGGRSTLRPNVLDKGHDVFTSKTHLSSAVSQTQRSKVDFVGGPVDHGNGVKQHASSAHRMESPKSSGKGNCMVTDERDGVVVLRHVGFGRHSNHSGPQPLLQNRPALFQLLSNAGLHQTVQEEQEAQLAGDVPQLELCGFAVHHIAVGPEIPNITFKRQRHLPNAVYRPLTDVTWDLGRANMCASLAVVLETLRDLPDMFPGEHDIVVVKIVSHSSSRCRCGTPTTVLASGCARLSWYDVHVVCVGVCRCLFADADAFK